MDGGGTEAGRDADWRAGAWPLSGVGPREGLPGHVWWPSRHDPTGEGGPTAWQTRTGQWRRTGRNQWVPAQVPLTPAQRVVESAALLPPHGAVTGWAALHWAGARWFDGTRHAAEPRPVALALGVEHTRRPRPGTVLTQETLMPWEIIRCHGIRLTAHVRSVAFEMRSAPSDEAAVVAFEMAAYDDLVSVAELAHHTATRLPIRRGVERVRRVLPWLEENSWSPMESVMRLTWVAAERPRPLANRPVFGPDGRFVGTPDLIDPVAGVYGQYDGALHLAGAQRSRDVAAEDSFRRLGLEPVTMLAGDLSDRSGFVRRLHAAYDRAGAVPADRRRWRIDPPADWITTHSVSLRRALGERERRWLLRYRRAA